MSGATLHRVRIPRGATPVVEVGEEVRPEQVLAIRRRAGPARHVRVTDLLGRPPGQLLAVLRSRPGTLLDAGEALARDAHGREVAMPFTGMLLTVSPADGSALVAPLGEEEPVIGHVHGKVQAVEPGAIVLEVPGVVLRGVGGTGDAVHGELVVAVHAAEEELRAGAIDVGATGRIVVGGSRASAETLTRARAMGVAGIVLGGVLDKELRDFEAIQQRRREIGGLTGSFGVLLLEGFGKVGIDPQRFAWLRSHAGRTASLFGADGLLFVHGASTPPARRTLPRVGERVVAHRRPFQGRAGVLVAALDELHAAPSGIPTRMGLVRFEDGRLAPVPMANLEATLAGPAAS
ncbi:MAG TPA: hypothetical protein VHK63_00450 [Candidatus Limnocylindria bacterium]|nr:hypothetical protein [Candidatus Limnocylindria bacterium]